MNDNLRALIVLIFLVIIVLIGWWLVMPKSISYQLNNKTYFLAAGAIFKNESHIMKEWLDHHKREGFEHIWLVNDNSTDDFMPILQPYIDEGYVTLYQLPDERNGLRKQEYALNHILYPIARKETSWFIANDLDEFITTRDDHTVSYNLRKYFNDAHIIRLDNIIYGYNNVIDIPYSAVEAYTKRINLNDHNRFRIDVKTICRPESIDQIDIHRSTSRCHRHIGANPNYPDKVNANEWDIDNYKIVMNHYKTQSYNFWRDIKMTRGDSYHLDFERSFKDFDENNKIANEVTDITLKYKVIRKERIDIVLSRYNESLDWLNKKKIQKIFRQKASDYDINLYIYNCGSKMELPSIPNVKVTLINIENRGMGLYKFLTHIINNYDNLAKMTMLIPGTGWHANKKSFTYKLLNGNWEARTIYTNVIRSNNLYNFTLDSYTNLGQQNGKAKPIELKPSPIRPFGKWYKEMTGFTYPTSTYVKTNFVDIIGFSREAIKAHPIELYQRLISTLDDTHTEAAHYLERSWYLFIQ